MGSNLGYLKLFGMVQDLSYWFLKQFFSDRASAGDALLLYFEFDDDGSDDFDDDTSES